MAASDPTIERSDRTDTRSRLIAAAVDLMVEHGSVDKVSLRSVAAGAGVSPTAVYRHFAGHEELLTSTTIWCWERFDEAVNGATADVEDPVEMLRAQCLAYLEFAQHQPGIYRVIFSNVGAVGTVRDDVGLPIFAKLVGTVRAALEAKGDDRKPLVVALEVFSWVHGIADLRLVSVGLPFPTIDAQVESLVLSLRLD